MLSRLIGALRVNLTMNSAKFRDGAREARRQNEALRASFGAMKVAATAAVGSMALLARAGLENIDRLAKSARAADGTASAFRAIELAASEAGVPIGALDKAVAKLARGLADADADGATPAAAALKALGLEAGALRDLPLDERLAVISDALKNMGGSAADAQVILRDLGAENKAFSTFLAQGGDAIRAAGADLRAFGLELDQGAVAQVERANDAMARMGLAAQALQDRLAIALAPALEAMANAFTNSLRDGGTLRLVLDALAASGERLAVIAATIAAFMAGRYVAAMAAARVATLTFSGALATLRKALVRTGIGAVVVLVGELIFRVLEARAELGSFGAAWGGVLRAVAATWDQIALRTKLGVLALAAGADAFQIAWLKAVAGLTQRFADFFNGIAGPLNDLAEKLRLDFRIEFGADSLDNLNAKISATEARLAATRGAAEEMRGALVDISSLFDFSDPINAGRDAVARGVDGLQEQFDRLAGAVDGSTDAAAAGLDDLGDAAGAFGTAGSEAAEVAEGLAGAFENIRDTAARASAGVRASVGDIAEQTGAAAEAAAAAGKEALAGLNGLFKRGLTSALQTGDFAQALGQFGAGLERQAQSAFGGVIAAGLEGGLGAITAEFGAAASGMSAALTSLGSGGGLAAIGGFAASALPYVGAVIAGINLIKGFSSERITGGGLDLDFQGQLLDAAGFETGTRSKFWGLVKRNFERAIALDGETQGALGAALDGTLARASSAFEAAGLSLSSGMVEAVEFSARVATAGKSEEEIARALGQVFDDYGNALSQAVAGIDLARLEGFIEVRDALGQVFDAPFRGAFEAMAAASEDLAARLGGNDALGQLAAAFYGTFVPQAEQLADAQEAVRAVFGNLDLELPETRREFRALVEAQDLMTEAGRRAAAELLKIAPVFDEIERSARETFSAQGGFASEIEERLAAAAELRGEDFAPAQYELAQAQLDTLGRVERVLSRIDEKGGL